MSSPTKTMVPRARPSENAPFDPPSILMHCKTGKETKKVIQNATLPQSQAAPKRIKEMFP